MSLNIPAENVKKAIIQSLVRQPHACVFPYVGLVDKNQFFNSKHQKTSMLLNEIIIKVTKIVDGWRDRLQGSSNDSIINSKIFDNTIKTFCIEYLRITEMYNAQEDNLDSVMAYIELLCLHVSFGIHEFYDFKQESIKLNIDHVLVYLGPSETMSNSPPLRHDMIDEGQNIQSQAKNKYRNNTEQLVIELKTILDYFDNEETPQWPGLRAFAITILQNKKYYKNW